MPQLSLDSTVQELYETPIGHDVLEKVLLQLNISTEWIDRSFIGRRKLRTLAKLSNKMLGEEFWNTLIALVNSEKDVPADRIPGKVGPIKPAWWKEAVVYQIRSNEGTD